MTPLKDHLANQNLYVTDLENKIKQELEHIDEEGTL